MKIWSTEADYQLTEWLVFATMDLAVPARERIKAEIKAHYADSVALHLAQGRSQTDAENRALAELGDFKTAAKAFQKRYLTRAEESWLRNYVDAPPARFSRRRIATGVIISILAVSAVVFVLIYVYDPTVRFLCPFTILSLGSLTLSRFRWSRQLSTRPVGSESLRKMLLLDVLQTNFLLSVNYLNLFLFSQLPRRHPHSLPFILAAVVLLALQILSNLYFYSKNFRLWRKLGYAQPDPVTGLEA